MTGRGVWNLGEDAGPGGFSGGAHYHHHDEKVVWSAPGTPDKAAACRVGEKNSGSSPGLEPESAKI